MSDSSVAPWTVACQAPLFMGFPRQESWSGLPCPPPGDLPNLGIKPARALALGKPLATISVSQILLPPIDHGSVLESRPPPGVQRWEGWP